jgi:hypothetical protein
VVLRGSSRGALGSVLSVVRGLQFDRWHVSAVPVQAGWWLYQPTHSAVASSTCSMVRQGLRGLIGSVLHKPMIVSASALP